MSQPEPMMFSRRFREVVAGENQGEVGRKLGFTQSRISQIARGEKPSREFVERLIDAYDLPREEWLALAGFGAKASSEDERHEIARLAAEETVKRLLDQPRPVSGIEFLRAGLEMLEQKYRRPAPALRLHLGQRDLTMEVAYDLLRSAEEEMEDEAATAHRTQDKQTPPAQQNPSK